jgi:hypothetical protein
VDKADAAQELAMPKAKELIVYTLLNDYPLTGDESVRAAERLSLNLLGSPPPRGYSGRFILRSNAL